MRDIDGFHARSTVYMQVCKVYGLNALFTADTLKLNMHITMHVCME